MSEIKYTSDGKKVVVVGKLNNLETIVQEVFVVSGNEIPSGENFVVKSLHDAPAISWKEKNLKEIEDRYDRDSKKWQNEIDRLQKVYRAKSAELSEKLKYVGAALANADESAFTTFVNYVCGNITHIVENCDYDTPKISTFEEFNQMYDDKLRLISIFGKSNGDFRYAIGDYNDASSHYWRTFIPCTSYKEAVEHLKRLIDAKESVYEGTIDTAQTYGIKVDPEKIKKFKEYKIKELSKNLESYQKSVDSTKAKIKEIKTKY